MNTLEFLRQYKFSGYAIFDLLVSFIGIYLLAPRLSKLFLKIRIDIPKINWVFLTLPIGILFHLLFAKITPMTADLFDPNGHYVIKVIIISSLILGLRKIKIVKKKH